MKKNIQFLCFFLALTLVFLAVFYNNKKGGSQIVQEFQSTYQEDFRRINENIDQGRQRDAAIESAFTRADTTFIISAIDSLRTAGANRDALQLTGRLNDLKGHYHEAINIYTTLTNDYPTSKTYGLRADAYLHLKKYDSAISDYRQAYFSNNSYGFALSNAFSLGGQEDSASFYLKEYLKIYPNDTAMLPSITN